MIAVMRCRRVGRGGPGGALRRWRRGWLLRSRGGVWMVTSIAVMAVRRRGGRRRG